MSFGVDGLTLPQPGDRDDVIGRILAARTPCEALLGHTGMPPLEKVSRFRRIVNQVHPDRCGDPRSATAFDQASYAFDALCVMDCSSCASSGSSGWPLGEANGQLPAPCRWWKDKGVVELDRMLEYRVKVTQILCENFAISDAGAGDVRLRKCLPDCQRMCENLDRKLGIPKNRHWYGFAPLTDPLDTTRAAAAFADVLSYLRSVHWFCHLLGRACESHSELTAASPPSAAESWLKVLLHEPTTETNAAIIPLNLAVGTADDDEDPLDVYMNSLKSSMLEGFDGVHGAATQNLARDQRDDAVSKRPWVSKDCTLPKRPRTGMGGLNNSVGAKSASENFDLVSELCSLPSNRTSSQQIPHWRNSAEPSLTQTTIRLATGRSIQLQTSSHHIGTENDAQEEKGLQNRLLGDLDSEESEIESKQEAKRERDVATT